MLTSIYISPTRYKGIFPAISKLLLLYILLTVLFNFWMFKTKIVACRTFKASLSRHDGRLESTGIVLERSLTCKGYTKSLNKSFPHSSDAKGFDSGVSVNRTCAYSITDWAPLFPLTPPWFPLRVSQREKFPCSLEHKQEVCSTWMNDSEYWIFKESIGEYVLV